MRAAGRGHRLWLPVHELPQSAVPWVPRHKLGDRHPNRNVRKRNHAFSLARVGPWPHQRADQARSSGRSRGSRQPPSWLHPPAPRRHSGQKVADAAFAGFTEPPYRIRISRPGWPNCRTGFLPNKGVHRLDIPLGGGAAGTDRPDRLIGDRAREALREAAGELPAHDLRLATGLALLVRFTHTDDRRESGLRRGDDLRSDQLIRLRVILPPLGVAENHQRAPKSRSIAGGDIPVCAPSLS